MFLTGFTIATELRGIVPASILFSSMVPYATGSFVLEIFSIILCRKWIRKIRNVMYKNYLRATLFIFENVSGVKVILLKVF